MRFRLTPREDSYYDMFADSANNLVAGARLLVELISDGADREGIADKMRACEHAGDEFTHAIMRRLNESFITPFDREDIYRLASTLDDVMDFMEAAADLVLLYQLDELPQEIVGQVEVLERAAELTAEAMPRLRGMKGLSEYWIEINRLENQGDQVYRRLLAELFGGEYDALTVLKFTEVVDQLEAAADAFDRFCQTPGPIVVGAVQGASCFGPAYEFALILDTELRRRKIRDKVPMTFVTSEPYIGHLGLDGVGDTKGLLESELRQRHIKWITNAKVASVEPGLMHVEEIAEDPRVIGVKEACGDIVQVAELARRVGDRLALYSGNDDQVIAMLALGGKGVISVLGNIAPAAVSRMVHRFLAGDLDEARRVQLAFLPLIATLFREPNPIPIKAAVESLGFAVGPTRLPLIPITEPTRRELLERMREMGITALEGANA